MAHGYQLIVKSPGLDAIRAFTKETKETIERELERVGNEATLVMQSSVVAKRSGATGTLAKSITNEKIVEHNLITIGIGKISKMFQEAPYWYVVNYGASQGSFDRESMERGNIGQPYSPPATLGSFNGQPPDSAKKGSGTDKFIHVSQNPGGPNYAITPGPIRPMNYIESASSFLSRLWQPFWAGKLKK